ncbi:MAG: zinc-binding dehydrogenase [Myxococcota bacterium]
MIVDPVERGTLGDDQRVLATGRRIVLGLLGGTADQLDLARLLTRHQTVVGTTLRSRAVADKAEIVAGTRAEIWPHVASGAVRPVIDAVLPIQRAEEAHERLRTNATVGKVVLTVA